MALMIHFQHHHHHHHQPASSGCFSFTDTPAIVRMRFSFNQRLRPYLMNKSSSLLSERPGTSVAELRSVV
jgi:hypothetical protein